uniref:Ribosomal RNA processing 12 homolog n=1 Tax=Oncorhynchus mykiss TaxID=8022 RepID=A0A8C7QT14_ONCMY
MVKSGKLKSGTASKLKRWKKGHSSDSNPQTSRFRQAAKSRFFSRPSEKSDLTVDALKLHNELQAGTLERGAGDRGDACMEETAEQALSERSAGTFLSGLSDCSNLTFRKVQRFWESNSAAHKEICAVLAAVTEVIRSQGGKETETEYFAALMTTLEAVDSGESLAAVAYLLNLVMKRVPAPVLICKFSDTAKALMDVMSTLASSESASALRWILSCLSTLLRKQDVTVWSYPSTLQTYHGLLSFTVHSKPKIRKAAQHGVCSILRGSDLLFTDNAPTHHPAAAMAAKFCIKEIEQAGGSKEDTTTLHVLGLLKDLMVTFPLNAVKSCCETLLRVMTLSHVLVTACAMQAFHKLFSGKPNPVTLSAELNAQIITALYDYLPSENDLQPLLAWVHYTRSSLSLGHLPRLFSTAMSCLLSPHPQVVSAATNTLKTLLSECVAPRMEEIGPVSPTASSGNPSYVCKMFRIVEEGLSYRFHASWPFVLQLLGCFYRAAGKHTHPVMTKSLQSLADLRSTPRFPFCGELDLAVGGAVESMGPEVLLTAVPLNITGLEDNLEFPRSWLIPVIRDHVKNTQLAYYTSYLLPLAATLRQRAEELEKAGQKLEAKVYKTLQLQIWTMLPGFCVGPLDLLVSFKGVARALGMAINERPDLRLTICQAIRTLITKSCNTEEEKAEVGRFAKNFLPILFNVFSQQPAPGDIAPYRMAVLDTIKVYLTVTDPQVHTGSLTITIFLLIPSPPSQNAMEDKLSVMDLMVAMAPCVDEVTMSQTFELIRPYLENKEPHMQKKAYRVLEEMCGGEREECRSFVLSHLETLKHVLLGTLKNASSPAKRPRLKCLIHIVKQLSDEHRDFITALLPEVIICTKEVSVGARKSAYTLLVEIGNAFIRFCGDAKEALEQYLLLVYVGLTGSVTMITCTVLALTRLVFEYKDMGSMEHLLHNVCLLLTSRTREIVKAALSFVKVILFVMDPKTLAGHVTMEGVGNIKDDVRRHFRTKLKNIFTKFIRKFGFELVKSKLPVEHHKVLVNIRKAEARTKRSRLADEDHDDSDSGDDNIEEILAESDSDMSDDERPKGAKTQKKPTKQKGRAWLKEGQGDEPLNFLDPTVSQRVLATNPDMKKRAKVQHNFKVTSDGRLIIKEDNDEGDKTKGSRTHTHTQTPKLTLCYGRRERTISCVYAFMQIFFLSAGGSGIHRPLGGSRDLGGDYKAKKGKGDVKRKGKVDPYAYIPLRKAQLNRRKKAKMQGQFKGMVRGAQKGAQSGKRMQRNKRRA